jgi:hypothetical protein
MDGDWRLEGKERCAIELKDLVLSDDKLKVVLLDEIAWKGKNHFPEKSGDNCYCCGGKKYKSCDVKYPLIIAENAPNPFNDKYRMIDGRHRMQKLLLNGHTEGLCYVFDYSEIETVIKII